MPSHRLSCLLVLTILIGLFSSARAQPLADRVPDDAMVYLAWQGVAEMGPAYEKSHLKAIIDATDWQQVYEQFVPALVAKSGEDNAEAKEIYRVASTLGGALWRYETAVYFGGLIAGQREGQPAPKLAILVRAGKDAPALVKEINDLLQQGGDDLPFKVKAAAYNDLVAVTTGAWPGFETLLGAQDNGAPAAPALRTSAKFNAAMAQGIKNPALAVYVDVEAIVKMVDGFIALGAKPPEQQLWRKARKIAGIGGVKQLACTGGFDGKDWVTRAFLSAPTPRTGLLALLDGEPMSDDILKLIPQDVTLLNAGRADFARLISTARSSTAAADPNWAQTVDQFLGQANAWAGLDIEKDLLASLGPEWAMYVSPTVGGNGLLGLCLVNRPRDPAKAESALAMLATRATDAIQRETDGEPKIAFKSKQTSGLTLHYLALPLVTPTWTVADGTLYVALYPQVVTTAAAHVKREGPSVLKNEKFAAVRKRLSDSQVRVASVGFADLPATAPNAYGSWLAISRLAGFADMFGVDSPLMLVPPMDRLMAELTPAGQTCWVDDAGWHYTSVTPFPAADLLAQDPMGTLMVAQPAVMASILVPSLNRARTTANRVKSASNLKQIGSACFLYSNEHRSKFPATLGELATSQDLPPIVFVNPNGNTSVPPDLNDKAAIAAWVNDNSDYVYLGNGKTNAEPHDAVIAYEKPESNDNQGMNILYGDGHIEWHDYITGMEKVQAQVDKDKAAPGKL